MSKLVLRKTLKAFMGYKAGAIIQLSPEDARRLETQGLVAQLKARKTV